MIVVDLEKRAEFIAKRDSSTDRAIVELMEDNPPTFTGEGFIDSVLASALTEEHKAYIGRLLYLEAAYRLGDAP
jgi:hypothetical protein